MQLIAFIFILFLSLAPVSYAGETVYILSANQDKFYSQFGGRVFQFWCNGKKPIYIKKQADGNKGWFSCRGLRTSPNAYLVIRRGRTWKRVK